MPRKKKRAYKNYYLQQQKVKMCLEGELESYVAKQLAGLDAECSKEKEEIEKEKKKKVEEVIAFQKQMERAQREPVDFRRDLYLIQNETSKNKAYKVTFIDHPEYHYIAFTTSNSKACAEGQKFIRDTYFPTFSTSDCPVSLREGRAHRCKELDEYAAERQAPIPALLKIGMTFACSGCGKIHFNYEDYATRMCFIVESDGDIVPYAKGMIFCYSCYHKYFD